MVRNFLNNPILYFIPIFFAIISCNTSGHEVPLEEVDFEPEVVRFDLKMLDACRELLSGDVADTLAFYNEKIAPFKDFLADYLYEGNFPPDSFIQGHLLGFLSDSNTLKLLTDVANQFPTEYAFIDRFRNPAKRFAYYFPEKPFPKIYTHASGYSRAGVMDMDQIIFSGRYLSLGLHYFMGADYPYYPPTIPMFIRRRCNEEHMLPLAFQQLADALIPPPDISKNPTLIDKMIHAGIKTEFLHQMLPEHADSLILYYTSAQMEWAGAYEARIYKEIQSQLYSVDGRVFERFLDETPFTKQLSRDSAPRMGQYIGWRIVQSYLKENKTLELPDLVAERDFRMIFKTAKYRPARTP